MIHLADLTDRTFEEGWEVNAGQPAHHVHQRYRSLWSRDTVALWRVGVFVGTFAEQWQEADVNVRVREPDITGGIIEGDRYGRPGGIIEGDRYGRPYSLMIVGPHKHGGDNLGPANSHGDHKSVATGGCYYNAWMWHDLPDIVVPSGSLMDIQFSMAEPGRGIHLGVRLKGKRVR